MKIDEKINYIIYAILIIVICILLFRTYQLSDYGGGDAGITRSIKQSIRTAQFIIDGFAELVRLNADLNADIQRLRARNTELENNYTALQAINRRLAEYIGSVEQAINSIREAGGGLINGVDRIAEIIRAVQNRAEPQTD